MLSMSLDVGVSPCRHAQGGRRGPVEVTVEDQQKINTFSQLNTRKHELEDMLRVKAVSS